MKKGISDVEKIRVMSRTEMEGLTKTDIQIFTPLECEALSFEQLDWLSEEQLTYFTAIQKKVYSINIATKSTQEIQKINLNALSDIELKSLLKHQIRVLSYDQIVNIQPYAWHKNRLCEGTIGSFRPKQYSFFSTKQLSWMTMYQSANIPRQYLSFRQISCLPPPCYEFPRDHFQLFIHRDEVPACDVSKLDTLHIKYMSGYTKSLFLAKNK